MNAQILVSIGPIVRINPYEVHVADPDFYDKIYAGAQEVRNKWAWHQEAAQAHGAIGHTPDHRLHKVRKDALSPFFSRKTVQQREESIKVKVERLCQRLNEESQTGRPVNLTAAYLAMCMDVITDYAFGEEYGLLNHENFHVKWRDTILAIVKSVTFLTHFTWLPGVLKRLPVGIASMLSPSVSQLLEYEQVSLHQISRSERC